MQILLIEDDVKIAKEIKRSLEGGTPPIITKKSAKSAMKYLQANTPTIMLLDYLLPDMNGAEFIETLQKKNLDIPAFIVFTDQGNERIAVDMMKLGARDYVVRDSEFFENLPKVVQEIANHIENEKISVPDDEQFQSIFDLAVYGIALLKPDTTLINANKKFLEIIGYTQDQLSSQNLLDLFKPHFSENKIKLFKQFDTNYSDSLEFDDQFTHKNGHVIWIRLYLNAVRAKSGTVKYYVVLVEDITKRKKLQNDLDKSDELFATANQVLLDGIYDWNILNNEIYFSPSFKSMLGYRDDELANSFEILKKLCRPDDFERLENNISESIENKSNGFELEFQMQHKNGHWVDIFNRSNLIFNDEGKAVRLIGAHTDVSERKKAVKKILSSEERFYTIYKNAPIMIQAYDANGKCILWNKECERLLGWTKEEAKSRSNKLKFAFPNRVYRNQFLKFLNHIDGQFKEHAVKCKDGTIRYQMHANFMMPNGEILVVGYDVHDQKLYQLNLEKSEEKYRKMVELSPDGMITMDKKGYFTSVNKGSCEITGLEKDDILGKHFSHISSILPQDFFFFPKLFKSAIMKEQSEPIEIRWKNKNGEIRNGEVKTTLIKEGNKVTGLQAVIHDITEKQKQQLAIQESELKYRSLVQQSNDAIYLLYESRFELINPKFTAIFGYTVEETSSRDFTFLKLIHPSSLPIVQDRIKKIEKGKFVEPVYEFRGIRKNGTIVECEVNVTYIKYKGKIATQGIVRDISARKKREQELYKISQVVEQSPTCIIICNLEGQIEYVNKKFKSLTGYSDQEVLGKYPKMLGAGDTPKEVYIELWQTITNGHEWKGRFHNKKKNQELYWEQAIISPLMDDQGCITHYIGFKEDITEYLKLEAQLRQSQKMDAVGKLAGGIAHDFNNLLTVINGYSDMLIEDQECDSAALDKISQIRQAGERAASLTRQLLAFSRKQILKPEIINLNDLLENMQKMLGRLIGEDIELSLHYAFDLKNILADPGQIEQIILNLILNARDALPEGGKITIETTQMFLDEEYCNLAEGLTPGHHAVISIVDNGTGMSKEIQEHIFEPFFTTKKAEKGTGLGLSTVYGIVRQSGGEVKVYSEIGFGSSFKVILPTVEKENKPRLSMENHLVGGTETLLLAEDEDSVRQFISGYLTSLGYQVLAAHDGLDAIKVAEQFQGNIDLLLTDVVMPNMSGKKLSTELVKIYPEIKICFMSGYTDNAMVHHGILQQQLHFIQKPFTRSTLATTLRKILD